MTTGRTDDYDIEAREHEIMGLPSTGNVVKRADTIIVIGSNYAQSRTWAEELARILGLPKLPKTGTFTNPPNLAGLDPATTQIFFVGTLMDRWTRGGYFADRFDEWRQEMVARGFTGGMQSDIERMSKFKEPTL